jgi:hypothetical protein
VSDFSPRPIEPAGSPRLAADAMELMSEVGELSLGARLFWAAFMLLMAWSCLWGAYAITRFHHWVPWAFAIVLLEPIGITALLAAVFLIAPSSGIGQWFAGAIRRAKFGLLALLLVMVGGLATVLFWWAWELYKLRH